jgi:hypothetical protein
LQIVVHLLQLWINCEQSADFIHRLSTFYGILWIKVIIFFALCDMMKNGSKTGKGCPGAAQCCLMGSTQGLIGSMKKKEFWEKVRKQGVYQGTRGKLFTIRRIWDFFIYRSRGKRLIPY